MLYANAKDSEKLYSKLTALLSAAEDEKGTDKLLVDLNDFYQECKFSNLNKSRFVAEIQDALTATSLIRQHGVWLFAEWDLKQYILVRISSERRLTRTPQLVKSGVMKVVLFSKGVPCISGDWFDARLLSPVAERKTEIPVHDAESDPD